MKIAFGCVLWLIAITICAEIGLACSCRRSTPPCSGPKNDVVFVGTVSAFIKTKEGRIATFKATESFSTSINTSVDVRTGFGGRDCGFDFEVGKSYLVYAGLYKGKVGTNICSRTREISGAFEDLNILREHKRGPVAARLFGRATLRTKSGDYDHSRSSISDAKVVAIGNGNSITTTTDSNGNYAFRSMRPGEYLIRILYGSNFEKTQTATIGSLPTDRCVERDFLAYAGARITGRILDESGKAVSDIRVIAAYYRNPDDADSWSWFEDYTDSAGRFEIEGLVSGTYTVGVNFDGPTKKEFPFPATFFPGVSDVTEAKRLLIREQKSYDGYDLRLAPRLIPRRLSGTVTFPDGSPARDAMVEIKEEKTTWRMDLADVDKDGRFTLSAFEGVSYYFYVYKDFASWGVNKESQKVFIPKTGVLEPLKIVVPKPQK